MAALNGDLDLAGFHCQWETFFGADLKTQTDCFFNVGKRKVFGFALTDAAWNGRTFDDPDAVFIPVDGDMKLH